MPIIKLPQNLQTKLGAQGSAELIQVFNEAEVQNRDKTIELLELRFEKKLESEVAGLRRDMDAGFMAVQKQFVEVQKQFGEVQKQITIQTKWVVGMIGFIAVAMKVTDLLVSG